MYVNIIITQLHE